MAEFLRWRYVLSASMWNLLLLFAMHDGTSGDTGRGKDDKEVETVLTGTTGTTGKLLAPPSYPAGNYSLDASSHVFILENTALGGSVELVVDDWNVHTLTWITIRNSKYGGYIGRVLGRYDFHIPPPSVIRSPTCCMRVEFQTGCCGPGETGFSGFSATYRFIDAPGGSGGLGRRDSCHGEQVYSQLCNGECMLEIYTCPCPVYGEFKCKNGKCLPADVQCNGFDNCGDYSDERLCNYVGDNQVTYEWMGSMFGFTVIISTVMSIVCTAFLLTMAIRLYEFVRSRKRKRLQREASRLSANCPECTQLLLASSSSPSSSKHRKYPKWPPDGTFGPRPEVLMSLPIPEPLPTPPAAARVTPINDFLQQRYPNIRSVAVLSTGRTPSVSVRPLPLSAASDNDDVHDDVGILHGEETLEEWESGGGSTTDDESVSSRCESGFHGEDEGCVIQTSSPASASSSSSASAPETTVERHVTAGNGSTGSHLPKTSSNPCTSPLCDKRPLGGRDNGHQKPKCSRDVNAPSTSYMTSGNTSSVTQAHWSSRPFARETADCVEPPITRSVDRPVGCGPPKSHTGRAKRNETV